VFLSLQEKLSGPVPSTRQGNSAFAAHKAEMISAVAKQGRREKTSVQTDLKPHQPHSNVDEPQSVRLRAVYTPTYSLQTLCQSFAISPLLCQALICERAALVKCDQYTRPPRVRRVLNKGSTRQGRRELREVATDWVLFWYLNCVCRTQGLGAPFASERSSVTPALL
jgi:hypothetical protein